MTGDPTEAMALAVEGLGADVPTSAGIGALPLEVQARVVGGYQWIERRLFEVLGGWVPSEPVAEARLVFDVYSQQHAWHADLWAERLPVLDGLDPATLTLPPSVEVDRLLALLAGGGPGQAPAAGGTLLRLVGLARVVLPRLVAGYGLHLRRAAPVADGPVVRSLRLVMRDEIEAWQATETLVESLVSRPHDIAVVTAHQQTLEEVLAGTGPGFVPWPRSVPIEDAGSG
ncbi:MAG TPA: hypothetical protein VN791_00235 [Acidimicrobiales bacterium]|nr:hypothetical protein [Acidimicrobiales bacterium]